MPQCRQPAAIPLLSYTLLALALSPFVLASPDTFTSPHGASLALRRARQQPVPHYSRHTRRQNAAQQLLCALGVTAACQDTSASVPAVDTNSDWLNCGAIGNVCPSSLPNGVGPVLCQGGQCVSACLLGFSWSYAAGACINTASDPSNCGAVGTVCIAPTGTKSVACAAGLCLSTECEDGYSLTGGTCAAVPFSSDANNCGEVGNVCPDSFANGSGSTCQKGACRPVSCNVGYDWDAEARACIDVRSDAQNCGTVGNVCTSEQTCSAGQCISASSTSTTSSTTSSPTSSPTSASSTLSSTTSGGSSSTTSSTIDGASSTLSATAASSASWTADPSASSSSASTTTTSSPSSAATSSTSEAADTITAQQVPAASASARARAKRAMVPPTSNRLCPDNLTACPIESSSFATARDGSSFETLRALVFAASTPPAAGPSLPLAERKAIRSGFECVDTRFETESCGGCASLGEGLNCAEDVPHARSTGCEEGRCVVFACEKGWQPNPSARACVRVHDAGRKRGHRRGQRRLTH